MLVLSRRLSEKIVFPQQSVTIEVLGIKGNTVRLGIVVPAEVRVLREELGQIRHELLAAPAPSAAHRLRNRLNKIALRLHLCQRQIEQDQPEAALATVAQMLELLDHAELGGAAGPRPFRSLVVDDDSNERELLAGLLSMQGCQADTAADGEAALAYLAEHAQPDFILLDMWMPRCDGAKTLAKIRAHPTHRELKVFAVSGASPSEAGVQVGPGGLDGWFSKPLNPRTLWQTIEGLLHQHADWN